MLKWNVVPLHFRCSSSKGPGFSKPLQPSILEGVVPWVDVGLNGGGGAGLGGDGGADNAFTLPIYILKFVRIIYRRNNHKAFLLININYQQFLKAHGNLYIQRVCRLLTEQSTERTLYFRLDKKIRLWHSLFYRIITV